MKPSPSIQKTRLGKLGRASHVKRLGLIAGECVSGIAAEKPWYIVAILTIIMSVATALGTYISSYLLLSTKLEEGRAMAAVDRKAKGAQLHCEKLLDAASLASEIEMRAEMESPGIAYPKFRNDVLAYERRAAALAPLLFEEELRSLKNATFYYYLLNSARILKAQRGRLDSPAQGGPDPNKYFQEVIKASSELASRYKDACTDRP